MLKNSNKIEIDVNHEVTQDITQAEQFLALLGQDQEFTFQTFDDSESRNTGLAKVFHGTLKQHAQALIDLNHRGAGVFVMVNEGDGKAHEGKKTCRTNANVTKVRANFIDLDEEAQRKFDLVMQSEVLPSIVVESSPNKYHCYWLVEDCPLESFKQVQQSLIAKFDSDKAINDLARVMRLPGFIHQKDTPFRTEFKDNLSNKQRYSKPDEVISNIVIALPETCSVADRSSRVSSQILEGQRNTTLTSMAGDMVARGINLADIKNKLLEINTAQCCPPLAPNEVEAIVLSVNRYRGTANHNTGNEPLTDVGNANRFAKKFAGTVKYVKDWDKFIIFNGHHWKVDRINQVMERAKQVAYDIYSEGTSITNDLKLRDEIAKHSTRSQQLQRLNAMIELVKSISSMVILSDTLNTDDMLIGVKNGVVDLRTGEFRAGSSADLITQVAPVDFDPNAQCPQFMQFIQETFPECVSQANNHDDQNHVLDDQNRQELLDYIHKALGYCLTGRTDQQCLMFGYGTGANGKTTLINVMLELLGNDYAMQTPMDTLMVKNNNNSSNHLARLQHVRFVASTEVEEGSSMSESLIKQITGGDRIAARFLYKEFIEFTPKFKLFIAGNHKPIIRGSDEGIWRRIHFIPFEAKIPVHKRDGALQQKLKSELPGILNWLIEGCTKWQQKGLALPKLMQDALTEYRDEMDTLGLWINECCKTGSGLKMRAQDAFQSYRNWANANEFHVSSSAAFSRKLSERFNKKRDSFGHYYVGISC